MNDATFNTLDFEIDKLTRSIENVISGDSFQTDISLLNNSEVKQVTRKNKWRFDWKAELKLNDREVYKLTIQNNPGIIQGLVSLKIESEHIYIALLESAPFNIGKAKVYYGVPGNLVAYACRTSFQRGFNGFISFHSKTKLIEHYEQTLGAQNVGGQLMIINSVNAAKLVNKYFKT